MTIQTRMYFIVILMTFIMSGTAMAQTVTGTRSIGTVAGGALDNSISVNIDPANTPSALFIRETIPAGWSLVSASHLGAIDQNTGEILWAFVTGIGLPVENVTLTYELAVPQGINDTFTFSGVLNFNDPANGNAHTSIPIGGDTNICVSSITEICNGVDDDCDGLIDEGFDADGDTIADCFDICPNDPDNDIDGDGVCGDLDNCSLTPNPGQQDTDVDGYGNACDCDLDNNGGVGGNDFNIFKDAWLSVQGDLKWNPDADFDSNGAVGGNDFNILKSRWLTTEPWQ